MKTIDAINKKWNVVNIPASEYYSSDEPPHKSGLTREKANAIAAHVNTKGPSTNLTADNIRCDVKNYVHSCINDDPTMDVAGAAQMKRKNNTTCSLEHVHVDPMHRRRGHGNMLLSKVEEKAALRNFKTLECKVPPDNMPMMSLLENYGFTQTSPLPVADEDDPASKVVTEDTNEEKPKTTWKKDVTMAVRKKKSSDGIKKTGKTDGKSNKLGYGGRAAQLKKKGVPGGVIGILARKAHAAPGQKNYHGKK